MSFPVTRLRRTRMNEALRGMVRETRLTPSQLIFPMFVCPGRGVKKEIGSMPGNYQWSVDTLVEEARSIKSLGLAGVILFGIPEAKDAHGSGAYDDQGIVQQAVRAIKREVKDLVVITDVCLCEYTSHGHCGLVDGDEILNDPTLDLLARMALSHAKAGADIVAPSDMMDGRVAAIRALTRVRPISTLIVGGMDRGYVFEGLAEVIVKAGIKNLILLPETGAKIGEAVRMFSSRSGGECPMPIPCSNMDECVKQAFLVSPAGTICLLSCASPSYNLFKNFEEKGRIFKEAVRKY